LKNPKSRRSYDAISLAATCFALARETRIGNFSSCLNHVKRRTRFRCRLTSLDRCRLTARAEIAGHLAQIGRKRLIIASKRSPLPLIGAPLKGGIRGGDTLTAVGGSDCYRASFGPRGQPHIIDSFRTLELLACINIPVQQSGRRRQGRSKPPAQSAAAGLWSAWLRHWCFLSAAFGGSSCADPGDQARQSLCRSPGQCPWYGLWPKTPRPDPHKLPGPNQRLRLCPYPWPAPAVPRQSRWLNRCQECTCQVTSAFGL